MVAELLKRAMATLYSTSCTSQRRPLIPPQFSVPFLCLKSDNDKIGSWAGWLHIIFSEYVWHEEEIFINNTVVWGPILSWPDAKDLNSLETNIPTWTVRKQVCSVSLNALPSLSLLMHDCITAGVSSTFGVFCSRRVIECTLY